MVLLLCLKYYIEDVDKELLLRDDLIQELKETIFLLMEERNSTVYILKRRIDSLTAENEQLVQQLLVAVKYEEGEPHKYLLTYILDLVCL